MTTCLLVFFINYRQPLSFMTGPLRKNKKENKSRNGSRSHKNVRDFTKELLGIYRCLSHFFYKRIK